MASVQNPPQDMEYSAHLQQWKQAFSQFYAEQQPSGQAYVAQAGSSAMPGKESAANPYSAVLTGLQSLLDGPLFKEQQPSQEVIAAALRAAGHPEAAAEAEQEAAEDEDEEEEEVTAAVVSPAARSPPGSRRPRKRQAATSSQGEEQESPEAAAPAATPAGRQPAAKKRRNTQGSTSAPNPPPPSASLNDLATLAAAVADEEEGFDDPVLGDQQQELDQGMLAAYQSGSLGGLSVQPEAAGTTGRGARGGSRGRQRTPAPSSSGADEGDSLGMSFPLVNEDGKPLTKQQIKRLRRQQSNRESARRSRQRKAEEANMLARRVGEMEVTAAALQAKNTALVAEVQQLRSIIEMMANDSSALAAQVGELGGTVSTEIMANVNWLSAARSNWLASGAAPRQGASAEQAA